MMNGMKEPKSKAIEELMAYLDGKDGEELGAAIKPKGASIEMTKVEKLGDEGHAEPDGDEGAVLEVEGDGSPKMSDEEMDELIQALQSKLGV